MRFNLYFFMLYILTYTSILIYILYMYIQIFFSLVFVLYET